MTIVNLSSSDGTQAKPASVTTTDVLIIGAGPAGASLACFLASYGELLQSVSSNAYETILMIMQGFEE